MNRDADVVLLTCGLSGCPGLGDGGLGWVGVRAGSGPGLGRSGGFGGRAAGSEEGQPFLFAMPASRQVEGMCPQPCRAVRAVGFGWMAPFMSAHGSAREQCQVRVPARHSGSGSQATALSGGEGIAPQGVLAVTKNAGVGSVSSWLVAIVSPVLQPFYGPGDWSCSLPAHGVS